MGATMAMTMYAQVFQTESNTQPAEPAAVLSTLTSKLEGLLNPSLAQRIKVTGYFQGGYTADEEQNSFELRRAVLMVDGQITDKWRMFFMHELKSARVQEAFLEYKVSPALQVRVGQYKNPFSIDNQLSPCVVEFINPCALTTDYYTCQSPADALVGGHGGRDQGLMLFGNLFKTSADYYAVQYNLAVMNGQGINISDGNNQKDLIATLGYKPFKEALISASIWEGRGHAVGRNAYVPDIHIGDNYRRARWSAGAEVKTALLNVRSEYMAGRDAAVRSEGYYANAALHVTKDLDLDLSYDYLHRNKELDYTAQTNYAVGASYWFYPACRLQLAYTYRDTHDDVLNPATGNLVQAGIQVRF
jgi:hypothetical protein